MHIQSIPMCERLLEDGIKRDEYQAECGFLDRGGDEQ